MSPDPNRLRLIAGSALVAAQHCEHVIGLIAHASSDVSQAEGGETMERRSQDMRRAAAIGREVSQSLLWFAGLLEEEEKRKEATTDVPA